MLNYTNWVGGKLAAPITDVQTTNIQLVEGALTNAPIAPFIAVFHSNLTDANRFLANRECILVTSYTGDLIQTCVRGNESGDGGGVALAWSTDDYCSNLVTAGMLNDVLSKNYLEFKPLLTNTDDANLVIESGVHPCDSTVANLPVALAGELICYNKSENVFFHEYRVQSNNDIYYRSHTLSGGFSAWRIYQLAGAYEETTAFIGEVKEGLWLNPPPNFLKLNGDTIPNGTGTVQGITYDFSAFYAYLIANIGSATLPDAQNRVSRGVSSTPVTGRELGKTEEDAIQNITGAFYGDDRMANVSATGAFVVAPGSADTSSQGSEGNGSTISFDASRVVRTATETRVKSLFTLKCIRYK